MSMKATSRERDIQKGLICNYPRFDLLRGHISKISCPQKFIDIFTNMTKVSWHLQKVNFVGCFTLCVNFS